MHARLVVGIGIGWLSFILSAAAGPRAVNYQGRLVEAGGPVNGARDVTFDLYTNAAVGAVVFTETDAVTCNDGLFSTALGDSDPAAFATALAHDGVWLQVTVGRAPVGGRERLLAVPYALDAAALDGAAPDAFVRVTGGVMTGALTNQQSVTARRFHNPLNSALGVESLASGGSNNTIVASASYSSIGGGYGNDIGNDSEGAIIAGGRDNTITASADYSVIGGGYGNDIGNVSEGAIIAGGFDNNVATNANYSAIGGGFWNKIGDDSRFGTIAGGFWNNITTNAIYSVIGGGCVNRIGDASDSATVAGGQDNNIANNADYSSISGGYWNDIANNSQYATIAGGYDNNLATNADYSSISGGYWNDIGNDSQYATVAGGFYNNIGTNASYGMILGGSQNVVANNAAYALAAGRRAQANHVGAFVWADSQNVNFNSTTQNQFSARCLGGARFTSGSGAANQTVAWTPGGGSWTFSSDRALKEGFAPVDGEVVLEKVAAMPLTEWNYTGYDQRHIGPMAQDFHAAFPLNDSDTTINSLDADGVALAAIQGLHKRNEALRAENAELRARIERLERLMGQ